MMLVKAPERKWVVSHDYPSGGPVSNTMSLDLRPQEGQGVEEGPRGRGG